MKSALVDTNVLISFLEKAEKTMASALSTYDELVVSPTVLGEFMAGAGPNRKGEESLRALEGLLSLDSVRVVPHSEKTSVYYAKIFRALKEADRPIPTNDIWIAASAMEYGVELCSYDGHFAAVPMLQFRRLPQR